MLLMRETIVKVTLEKPKAYFFLARQGLLSTKEKKKKAMAMLEF